MPDHVRRPFDPFEMRAERSRCRLCEQPIVLCKCRRGPRIENPLRAAFVAGFMASHEDFNGEYPFDGQSPEEIESAIRDLVDDWCGSFSGDGTEGDTNA